LARKLELENASWKFAALKPPAPGDEIFAPTANSQGRSGVILRGGKTLKRPAMGKPTSAILACIVFAAAMLTTAAPARAEEPYAWCAIYSGGRDGGGTNCGFVTWAQCMATISGIGGICQENPDYPSPIKRPVKKPRRKVHSPA
jgi:hypothetical protein